ncbi:MAG: 3-oxoacyl-[acyl-carrier-protein] reductase [Jaaginema sp. PMC 1079.18]|nr:3-oxoacyl-[acyl-carrier-protein] reductase [Jaaginema sp. PMC 1080.18]MEC4851915.1 3-oxoacyl-[acyl-carrier-protein] reductase [Jaaginema sp. PMC 1079.18]MEC4867459.1 3-oxoacyl-[acyl-carrier-protein] reductase [Jaaginema sp. PMC 1078.18]
MELLPENLQTLRDRVAIVTGASRGIGKAIALELARVGATVVVNYARSSHGAEAVVAEITEAGGNAIAIQADVSRFDEANHLITHTKEELGRVDVLVNNAGITRDGLVMRMKLDDWQAVIDLNLTGVFLCTKAASSVMLRQKSGRIINIASVSGLMGIAGQANYSAAKAGVIGFSKAMAKELSSRGITVNVVAPGFINTDMTQELKEDYKQQVLKEIPLGRYGEPEDIAGMVRFLASDPAAAYITGQTFNVDGGLVMG